MRPLKDAVRIMLKRIQLTTYYPPMPTSGSQVTLKVYSSRAYHDWFISLNADQRAQLLKDSFHEANKRTT